MLKVFLMNVSLRQTHKWTGRQKPLPEHLSACCCPPRPVLLCVIMARCDKCSAWLCCLLLLQADKVAYCG